ncbi:MAG TPA: SirB2 family protein [Burkholderiales bacterium]|nr:SirB2 family protein [Burkholderiales bacterium]
MQAICLWEFVSGSDGGFGFMEFSSLKVIHIGTVAVSYTLFFVRGIWMLSDSPLLHQRWVRTVPHVNDTVLLVTGIWMTTIVHQYPGTQGWLTAKLAGLVIYILLGLIALRPGRAKRVRVKAWIAAQIVFGCIVAVAIGHDPLPCCRGALSG